MCASDTSSSARLCPPMGVRMVLEMSQAFSIGSSAEHAARTSSARGVTAVAVILSPSTISQSLGLERAAVRPEQSSQCILTNK